MLVVEKIIFPKFSNDRDKEMFVFKSKSAFDFYKKNQSFEDFTPVAVQQFVLKYQEYSAKDFRQACSENFN